VTSRHDTGEGADRVRLFLDISATPDGHYQGLVTVPSTASGQEFSGILELLAILEQLLLPGANTWPTSSGEEE
jgi:hypothetical protein